MIGGVTKFGGTSRDARALTAHLGKPQLGASEFIAINSAAANVGAIIAEARTMAASRRIADRPFLHVFLSPSGTLSRDQLIQAAEVVARELGVCDQPWGIELHGKSRSTGEGERHAHLVIGRVGASGRVLPSGFEKIRVETACRIAEFEVGDAHVPGRHFASSVRHLEKAGRLDVVESMRIAFGGSPGKPTGSLSPERRQKLERMGVDGVVQRQAVRAAWERSDDGISFIQALADCGLDLTRGDKPGVWIIVAGGVEIGAVDRLIGEKRHAVASRLHGCEPAAGVPDRGADTAHDEAGGPRGAGSAEDLGGDRGIDRGLGWDGGGERAEPGSRTAGTNGDDARDSGGAFGPLGEQHWEDRGSPDPACRRSAVAALTVHFASRAVAHLDRLKRMALQVIAHDTAALRAVDEREVTRLRNIKREIDECSFPLPQNRSDALGKDNRHLNSSGIKNKIRNRKIAKNNIINRNISIKNTNLHNK